MSSTSRLTTRSVGGSLLVVAVALTIVLSTGVLERTSVSGPVARGYPPLFPQSLPCPRPLGAGRFASRLEEKARLRQDRYLYSPSDGILAVRRYLEAAACYRAAGRRAESARADNAASRLSVRVDADYAAARLNLSNALEREQWRAALQELRRLRSLTQHVEAHAYVDWLEEIGGRLSVRASSAP